MLEMVGSLTSAFQPRRLMVASAAAGCKRLLGSGARLRDCLGELLRHTPWAVDRRAIQQDEPAFTALRPTRE